MSENEDSTNEENNELMKIERKQMIKQKIRRRKF